MTENRAAPRCPRPAFWVGCLLAVLTFLVYSPALRFEFIGFDDPDYVTMNPHIQKGISGETIRWAFTSAHAANWHPLTWLSHALDWQLFGADPAGPHLVNVLFHIANTLLLFGLLRFLTATLWRSAFVAMLFALHPLHVESVAWIAERKDVLSAFFGLLCLGAYARYARVMTEGGFRGRTILWYFLALGSLAAGLLSKPMLVTWPFVLLLLDFWPLARLDRRKTVLLEKIPFFLLVLAASALTLWAQSSAGAVASLEHTPLSSRLANAVISYGTYLQQSFLPLDLAIPYPFRSDWPWWKVSGILCILGGLTFAFWQMRTARPWFLMGWLWYLGTLLPVIGLVRVGNHAWADRYTYLPLLGVFLAVAWGAGSALGTGRFRRWGGGFAFVFITLLCLVSTGLQLRHWRNTETLFTHTLRVTTNNPVAHNYLGVNLLLQQRYEESARHFQSALKISPQYKEAQNGLAAVQVRLGKTNDAIAEYEAVLEKNPGQIFALNNLIVLLASQGRIEEALVRMRLMTRLRPDDVDSHFNLAKTLDVLNQTDEAELEYRRALALNPRDSEARKALALLYGRTGRPEKAAEEYAAVASSRPEDAEAQYYLGLAKVVLGNKAEAIPYFRRAIELKTNSPLALNDLAWILATHPDPALRDGAAAVTCAERACQLSKNEARYFGTLDAAYAEAGRFEDALTAAQECIRLATAAKQDDLVTAARQRMALYGKKMPYHEPAPR